MQSNARSTQDHWRTSPVGRQSTQPMPQPSRDGGRFRPSAEEGFMRVAPLDEPSIMHSGRVLRQATSTAPVRFTPPQTGTVARFDTQSGARPVLPPGTRPIRQTRPISRESVGTREMAYLQGRNTGAGVRAASDAAPAKDSPSRQTRPISHESVGTREMAYLQGRITGAGVRAASDAAPAMDSPSDRVTAPVQTGTKSIPSSNLLERDNGFWERPVQDTVQPEPEDETEAVRRERGDIALKRTFFMITGLTLLVILVSALVFVVRDVQVIGAPQDAVSEVLQAAGIQYGQRITELNEAAVARNVNHSSRWSFKSMKIIYPSSIVIEVQERSPVAVLRRMGIQYFIDGKGMVLAQSEDIDAKYVDMPEISGLKISHCQVGSYLDVLDETQWTILRALLVEMKAYPALRMITNINLADPANILLSTIDGYSVRLGNQDKLHAKLKALVYVVNTISQDSSYGLGTLDIRTPEKPTFSPETQPITQTGNGQGETVDASAGQTDQAGVTQDNSQVQVTAAP